MANMNIYAESVYSHSDGPVTISGFDIAELVAEIGGWQLLEHIDYSEILEYVAEIQEEEAAGE